MTTRRLLAIGFIFVCTAVAWSILGTTVVDRTIRVDNKGAADAAFTVGYTAASDLAGVEPEHG